MRAAACANGWLPIARAKPSVNADSRPDGVVTDLIVLHHISLPPGYFGGQAIESLFCNTLDCNQHPAFDALRGLRVSSHFLIRRHGALIQFVDMQARAWHAGASLFMGRERCNDFSIGIELEGDGLRPFTDSQYRKLDILIEALCEQLPIAFLAGHSDIAPGRKFDPGPCFDWARLHKISARLGLKGPWLQAPSKSTAKRR